MSSGSQNARADGTIEYWHPTRLHDRLRYRREGDRWLIERLAP
jgi:pyridoxamine 5'-phosphate oxidase